MKIISAYKNFWKGYFDFKGRTDPGGYWWAVLANFVVTFLLIILASLSSDRAFIDGIIYVLFFYSLACFLPSIAIKVRRLRDAGKSWTNLFWILLPFAGAIILIVKLCAKTQDVWQCLETEDAPDTSSYSEQEVGCHSKKLRLAGILVLALAVGMFTLYSYNEKQRRYNEGVSMLEKGELETALQIFTELGNFDDSRDMAKYARMEMDYLSIDSLSADGNYGEIINILRERSEWYGDSEKGKESAALADEYETLMQAIEARQNGLFKAAEEKYGSLHVLADSFASDRCLCLAHMAEDERNWMDVLAYLYASDNGDYMLSFLDDSNNSDNDYTVRTSYYSGKYEVITEVLEKEGMLQDDERKKLKTAAENGFHYDAAQEEFENGEYEKAMEGFLALGDFLDSEERYEESKEKHCEEIYNDAENYLADEEYVKAIDAFLSLGSFRDSPERLEKAKDDFETYKENTYKGAKKYYKNGEYYKAKKLFLKIIGYKDAEKRSEKCEQELPSNGALKTGNGSSTSITVTAPSGDSSAYLKIYNSSGDTVGTIFLRPEGSGTIYLSSGDYTMKVAYGVEWYGETDLFGENGSYHKLMNGSNDFFSLSRNYTYTLELRSTTQGNVPTIYIGGADDM